ncbi:MAG: ribonuclease Z [Deltaproteobacteria bacterium HGW-Deltaproteobacteria-4]|nr:MAG: ribonuclease Z [Deltaproteobacteria bacterium HGW-Deltaproteobacteria-4]
MTPIFHPFLINSPFDDPAVFVDFLYSRRAILFDLGTLNNFSTRKLLRTGHVFVSHAHIDHFIGFDHLLRLCLGRDKHLHLYGPPGFVEQIRHRLAAYSWNLVFSYDTDFTIIASEVHADGRLLTGEFHCQRGFALENFPFGGKTGDLLHDEAGLRVRVAHLDHKIPSLAFALEEKWHLNIMKNRLAESGLAVGPWLKKLKEAIVGGLPDDTPMALPSGDVRPLGELKETVVRISAGQKICYVTDAGYTPENAAKIVALAQGADYLFIEATFLQAEAERASERSHLTARQAGELARAAGVSRVIPFHFSPKYRGREAELRAELEQAWHRG